MSPKTTEKSRNGVSAPGRVTPDDLRTKFTELQGEVDQTTSSAKDLAVTVGAAVGVVIVLGVFILGARRGRKRTTVVEIRRV